MYKSLFLVLITTLLTSKGFSNDECVDLVNRIHNNAITKFEKYCTNQKVLDKEANEFDCNIGDTIFKEYNTCIEFINKKNQCLSINFNWNPIESFTNQKPWVGKCESKCADGTDLRYLGGREQDYICMCPKGLLKKNILPGEAFEDCNSESSESIHNSEDTGGYGAKETIDSNPIKEKLEKQLEDEREKSIQTCNEKFETYQNRCSDVKVNILSTKTLPNSFFSNAESCTQLRNDSNISKNVVNNQHRNCTNLQRGLDSFCKTETGSLTEGDVTVLSLEINQNKHTLDGSAAVLAQLKAKSTAASIDLDSVNQKAQNCIEAFTQDVDTSSPVASSAKTFDPDLLNAGQNLFNSAASLSSGGSGELSGGGSGRVSNSKGSNTAFNSGELGGGGSGSNTSFSSSELGNGGGGGSNNTSTLAGQDIGFSSDAFDTETDQSSLNKGSSQNNTQRNLSSQALSNAQRGAQQQNSRLSGLSGGALGLGSSFGAGVGSQNTGGLKKNGKRQTTGSYESSDHRNLINGYKKTKKHLGRTLTYHPDDLKKHGREKLLKMAKEAEKRTKTGAPLVFDGVSFMPDFLEMQKSKKWKYYHDRMMKRFYKVDTEKVKKNAFHPCVLKHECYSNEDYNIFRLHHLRYQKLVDQLITD